MEKEGSGLPKKNIILAAVLAFGFYWAWSLIVPKMFPQYAQKPSSARPSDSAPQQAVPADTRVQSAPSTANAATTPQEISFRAWQGEGKLLLGNKASITEFSAPTLSGPASHGREPVSNKTDLIVLPGSSFFETTPSEITTEAWMVKKLADNYLQLELKAPAGTYEKEFVFNPEKIGFGTIRLRFISSRKAAGSVGVGLHGKLALADKSKPQLFAGYVAKKSSIIRFIGKKDEQVPLAFEDSRPLKTFGISGRYHLALIYEVDKMNNTMPIFHQREKGGLLWNVNVPVDRSSEIPFYLGLKTERAINELGLKNIVYGGWLGPFKRLIRNTLSLFYRATGNYGVAIILLTLVFQILLIPFTLKNLKFSQKMKELTPKIKQLQAKYKHDPRKMNAEMMQLYKTYGTNPLGGCFVLVLQMPIFFALYSALNDSYELYGAPFVLWIKNLASYDPTYILPILMGAAMFIQTKKTQAPAGDSSQKMLSYTMPIMFTFMFLKFPSGLVLYWFTSNIISLTLMAVLPKITDQKT